MQKINGVIQEYDLKLKYESRKNEDGLQEHRVTEAATSLKIESFRTGKPFKLQDFLNFQKASNAIMRAARKELESGGHVEATLIISAYRDVPAEEQTPDTSPLKQLSFNLWRFDSCADEDVNSDEAPCLHLAPDPQNENQRLELYVPFGQDFVAYLAEVGL